MADNNTPKLYQFAILWHPTKQQKEDEGMKSKVVAAPDTVLASDDNAAFLAAARNVPDDYADELEQIEIALRPF